MTYELDLGCTLGFVPDIRVPKITVRQTDDLDTVHELDRACFPSDKAMLEDELNKSVWWIAYADKEPVGFAGLTPDEEARKGFMIRAGVLPEARGAGIQRRLIRARVAYCTKQDFTRIYTYVWAGNIASMKSVVRSGFVPYYWERTEDPMTLIYFERELGH